jgi:ferredoxin-NADP reductase
MRTYRIMLLERIETAKDTYIFSFTKPADFSYHAGQYISLCVEPPEVAAPGGTMRELSLSSAPYEDVITTALRFRDTPAKKQFMQVKPGEQMYMQGPFGTFQLQKSVGTVVFLAGGIGITPLLSIVKQALYEKQENDFIIFFSNRSYHDMPFLPELHMLTRENKNIRLINTLTLVPPDDWKEERGYISTSMILRYLKHPPAATYYVAGPQRFVGGMWEVLDELGVAARQIHGEEFTGY